MLYSNRFRIITLSMENIISGMGQGQEKKKRQKAFSAQLSDSPSQWASFQLQDINRSLRKSQAWGDLYKPLNLGTYIAEKQ